jgi:hypothetical protein
MMASGTQPPSNCCRHSSARHRLCAKDVPERRWISHHFTKLTLSPSRPFTLSPSHPLTLSPSHPLALSPSHPLTLSPSHPLTPLGIPAPWIVQQDWCSL